MERKLMSNQQIAEAIFDKLYEDIAYTAKNPDEQPQAEMLNRLFRHLQVKKIREVLEKCQ
jgi:hypothetical protein